MDNHKIGSTMLVFRRLFTLSILLVLTAPMAVQNVSADGMSMGYSPDRNQWWLLDEDMQFAVINFNGSYENLLLQASISAPELKNANQSVWLFPIPSSPQNATIGIYGDFPALGGYFLSEYAKYSINKDFVWMYSTQIYTIPFALSTIYTTTQGPTGERLLGKSEPTTSASGVDVFQHIEQFGFSTELVSASEAFSLDRYLGSYGITLPANSNLIVQDYINRGYSFVASRISNVTSFMGNATQSRGVNGYVYGLSVAISFPTPKIFYPMRLSSAYGTKKLPIVLEIVGYVAPSRVNASVNSIPMETDFCFDPEYNVSNDLEWFFADQSRTGQLHNGVLSDLEFSLVVVNDQADHMTYDLWFEKDTTSTTDGWIFMKDYGWAVLIPVFVGFSAISSFLSGSFVYRGHNPKKKAFALLGLSNATTIIGLILITRWLRVDETLVAQAKNEPLFKWKAFVILFSLIFIALCICCQAFINFVLV